MRLGVTPEINAISTVMIAFVTVGVLIASYMTKRSSMMREREMRAVDQGAA